MGFLSMTTSKAAGFVHRPHVVRCEGKEAHQKLDPLHLIISLLKRWLEAPIKGLVMSAPPVKSLSVTKSQDVGGT